MPSLTEHLLSICPESRIRATQHSFLLRAGQRTLSKHELESWLTQDRLYALCGYTRLMGNLISRLNPPAQSPDHDQVKIYRKRLRILVSALANIDREIEFFEKTASDHHLNLSVVPSSSDDNMDLDLVNPITRGYIDYMVSVSSSASLAEGFVLLWAMEELYFQAWTFALQQQQQQPSEQPQDLDLNNALNVLIPNWTCIEFRNLVDEISQLVNELDPYETQGANVLRLERVWKTTLWYEERFWLGK